MSGCESRNIRQLMKSSSPLVRRINVWADDFPDFDGSQDWVIAHNDVVAGSSPASGTKCRSSSVEEHVIPSSFLIRRHPNAGSRFGTNHNHQPLNCHETRHAQSRRRTPAPRSQLGNEQSTAQTAI